MIGHELMPGAMIASSIMMARALAPIETAIAHWRGFATARDALGRLKHALARVGGDPARTALPRPSRSLTAENLAVAAPEGTTVILRHVGFSLAAGEVMGIIGPSGSGKTSLVRALVGAWPPPQGTVRVDGAALVEAKVAPQDIDQVAVGAAVHVRIGAGNRRTTPDLEGRVTVVSPDLTRDAEGMP